MKRGNIIVLNGTSSSGKSSVLKALQQVLDEPYLDAGIDKFIFMLPKRYLDVPLWHEVFEYTYLVPDDPLSLVIRAGPLGHQLMAGMHRSIATLAEVDTSILNPMDCALQIKRRLQDGSPLAFRQIHVLQGQRA